MISVYEGQETGTMSKPMVEALMWLLTAFQIVLGIPDLIQFDQL